MAQDQFHSGHRFLSWFLEGPATDNGGIDVSILVWYDYAYHVIQNLSNNDELTTSKWQYMFYFSKHNHQPRE